MSRSAFHSWFLASLSNRNHNSASRRRHTRSASPGRSLRVEPLEDRRLLAITVDTLVDEADGSIVDGDVSLRDAIAAAAPGETIDFSVTGTISLALGEMLINKSLSIAGPGRDRLTIDAHGASRIFDVTDGNANNNITVSFSGMTLTGGAATSGGNGDGGAIRARENLVVEDMAFLSNNASFDGGAVYFNPAPDGSTLTVRRNFFYNNRGVGAGGGVYAQVPLGGTASIEQNDFYKNSTGNRGGGLRLNAVSQSEVTIGSNTFRENASSPSTGGGAYLSGGPNANVTVTNSTFSGNTGFRGAGLYIRGGSNFAIKHTTIARNSATGSSSQGGGLGIGFASVTLDHTIIAENTVATSTTNGPDIHLGFNGVVSASYSLIGNNRASNLAAAPLGAPDANGNFIGTPTALINPLLAPLADAGGWSKVLVPMAGSPVINAGNAAIADAPSSDQRGGLFARIANGDSIGPPQIDIGAVEVSLFVAPAVLTVDTLADEIDGNYDPGYLSLREAIGLSNADVGLTQSIIFNPALAGGTLRLERGALNVTDAVDIQGLGAAQLTIDAQDRSQIFFIHDGNDAVATPVSLRGLTLTGGNASGLGDNRSGGAIFSREVLALADSVLTGNEALAAGGALTVASLAGGSISVDNVVFSENTAGQLGGGAYLAALNGGTTTITNSAFIDNQANSRGGGLYFGVASGGIGRIEHSRFMDNTGNFSGAGVELTAVNGVIDFERNYVAGNNTNNFGGGIQLGIASGHTIRIRQSTIFDNDAGLAGGGIAVNANTAGTLLIENSTVSGNRAVGNGGGIWLAPSNGTNEIHHSTITGNTATVGGVNQPGRGGGVYSRATLLKLDHTIVAGNTDGAASPGPDVAIDPTVAGGVAAALDARFSLLGANAGTALAEAPVGAPDAKGNLVGGPTHGIINALLDALADNGSTQLAAGQAIPTHAPLAGSPVVDVGDPSATAGAGGIPERDQRGAPHTRVFNGDGAGEARIDIGAVELQVVPNAALGDFNQDNSVDAADYTLWRDKLGTTGLTPYSFADGDGDGTIDADDYQVWRANFGRLLASGGGAGGAASTINLLAEASASELSAESRPAATRRGWIGNPPTTETAELKTKSEPSKLCVAHHPARLADAGLMAWLSTQGDRAADRFWPRDPIVPERERTAEYDRDDLLAPMSLTFSR